MTQTLWWLDEPSTPADSPEPVITADEVAAWAASAEIGTGLLTPFGVLDPAALSEAGQVDALVALERLRSWTDAQQARVFAAMVSPGEISRDHSDAVDPSTRDKQWLRDEIGCALRLAPTAVNGRLHESRELVRRLPSTLALLESGAITARHVAALVDAVSSLDDATANNVETRVLPRAGEQTAAAFRRCVRRAAAALDPADAEQRHRRSLADRRVCSRDVGDGMGELWALLPLDGLAELMTTLQSVAGAPTAPGDERTADQRRADALVSLAAQRLHGSDSGGQGLPTWRGRHPSVQVTVSAATLLGLDDDPAEIEGYGPIPASVARRIAADPSGIWRRLLLDPARRLIEASDCYRPPAALAAHVIARDRTCRFPGCTRAARRCEIDHQIPWPVGPTSADNLECLCSRHHHLKHEAGWTVTGDPAGEITWISPTGHIYRSPPPIYE